MTAEVTMDEVMRAVGDLQAGEPVRARALLLGLWERLGPSADAMMRCTVAHFLADTEAEPERELEWDLRALAAATGEEGEGDFDAVTAELAAFLPSLHLNAGDACRRLGRIVEARNHAEIGLRRAHALADDGYGGTIKAGLKRLHSRLAE